MTQLLTPPSFVLCFLLSLEMYNSFCWVFKSHFPEKELVFHTEDRGAADVFISCLAH